MRKKIITYFSYYLRNRPLYLHFLFEKLRPQLVQQAIDYPSVINNGWLHIEQAVELAKFLKLDPRNAIIDVGAADGTTAKKFSAAFPLAKVYAFEPVHQTYELLQKETCEIQQVIAVNRGLGAKEAELAINLAGRITSSSLLPISKNIKNAFFAEHLENKGMEKITISIMDKEIPGNEKVNILKIDVQGYELEVLEGGINTLKNTSLVVAEMQNHLLYENAPQYYDIDSFLRKQNFTLYNILPSIRQDKKLYEWDAIYVNRVLHENVNN